jgi:hypothetical protein
MRTTTTLDRLLDKPLNAKYYPFDVDTQPAIINKKQPFIFELAQFFVDVMSMIQRSNQR